MSSDAVSAVGPKPDRKPVVRWLPTAILFVVGATGAAGSLGLGVFVGDQPGPGLWPLIVSVVIIICAIAMGPQDDVESVSLRELRTVGSAVLLLGFFAWTFTLIGIFVPTFVVLFVWLRFLARRGWLLSALTAAGTAAALYLVFTYVFGVRA